MAQSVKGPTLGFSSGHDLTVRGFEPLMGLSAISTEPTLNPLPPSLCLSLPYSFSLSKYIHTYIFFKKVHLSFNIFSSLHERRGPLLQSRGANNCRPTNSCLILDPGVCMGGARIHQHHTQGYHSPPCVKGADTRVQVQNVSQ